ncbi:MAG: TlpA disulfide reductase family protein [Nitrolancea sp.]
MPVETGVQAPTFSLRDADEIQTYSLSDALSRGPVLIAIYKSSCQASKTIFPFLEKIHQGYSNDEITVWGIAQDSPNVTRSFARRTGVTFPMLIDDDDYAVSRAYDIMATPTIYLIDRDGKIVWQVMGFQLPAMDELTSKVAELVGGEPLDLTSGAEGVPAWVPG